MQFVCNLCAKNPEKSVICVQTEKEDVLTFLGHLLYFVYFLKILTYFEGKEMETLTKEMSVCIQKRGEKWQYRIQYTTADGVRKSMSKSGFLTKKDARCAGERVKSDLISKKVNPDSIKECMSMKQFFQYWIENYCENNLKESTIRGYKKNLNNLVLPYIGEILLSELNASDIQAMIDKLIKSGYALNRVQSVKGILTGSLDFAQRMQYIAYNPAYAVRLPNRRKLEQEIPSCLPKVRRPITEDEWQRIITRYPEGSSAHFALVCGYRLGNRLGESFGYTWDDVNWAERTITVRRQVLDKVKQDENGNRWYISLPKYNSSREIELDDATYGLLLEMKKKWEKFKKWFVEIGYDCPQYYIDEENVIRMLHHKDEIPSNWKRMDFINVRMEDGTFITPAILKNVSRVIHGKANNRGIDAQMGISIPDFCYHALRHTHGTALIEAGVDYKYVTERLGHKNIETTLNIYVHSTKKLRDKERRALNNLYN